MTGKKKRERKVDWLTDRQINMLIEIKKSSGKSERRKNLENLVVSFKHTQKKRNRKNEGMR